MAGSVRRFDRFVQLFPIAATARLRFLLSFTDNFSCSDNKLMAVQAKLRVMD
jgi:hypothetical protein